MNEYQEIPINKIIIKENTRTRIEIKDLSGLIESIKTVGLLHPIGVYKEDDKYVFLFGRLRLEAYKIMGRPTIGCLIFPKPSEDSILSINIIENLHRKNISQLELGRACGMLHKKGYSYGEIASIMAISKTTVVKVINVFDSLPQKYQDVVGFTRGNENKNGRIALGVAEKIAISRLSKDDKRELCELARLKELTVSQIKLLIDSVGRGGLTIKEAFKSLDQYRSYNAHLILDKEEVKKIQGKITDYLIDIIEDKIPPHPGLILRQK